MHIWLRNVPYSIWFSFFSSQVYIIIIWIVMALCWSSGSYLCKYFRSRQPDTMTCQNERWNWEAKKEQIFDADLSGSGSGVSSVSLLCIPPMTKWIKLYFVIRRALKPTGQLFINGDNKFLEILIRIMGNSPPSHSSVASVGHCDLAIISWHRA